MHQLRLPTVLLALCLALSACSRAAEVPPPTTSAAQPTTEPAATEPTTTTEPAATEPAATEPAEGNTWLVMLYSDADDEVLEKDIFTDLNEAEAIDPSSRITVVAQIDRYKGAFDGDGDWNGARRIVVGHDSNLDSIGSQTVEDLGEVNMADGQTLVDFATWAINSYPADHYALILSDHGMGWPGGWPDPDPGQPGPDGQALTSNGDLLLLNEIDDALGKIREATNVAQFDILGMDACLMGDIEVAAALAPHAHYMVASQETEPSLGWAYASFLSNLDADPAMDAAGLSKAIVESYIDQDMRIVDDTARAAFLGDDVPAAEAAAQLGSSITLGAYDLTKLPELMTALDGFIEALAGTKQDMVAEARTYAQSFTSVFGQDVSPSYIDLGNFAQIVAQESGDATVQQAADNLLAALHTVVIAERHTDEHPGATGLSIYFPDSGLYTSDVVGAQTYATIANRFSETARWDDFLSLHYYGTELGVAPQSDQAVVAPGQEKIALDDIVLSKEEINVADSTTVSTKVTGEKIGFIYSFTGYYDPEEDTILVADMDYIDAGQSRQVGGIFYPDWGDEGSVEIEYEWSPKAFGIDDGNGVKFALLMPDDYGDTNDAVTYSVDGHYTFAGGDTRYAQLFFKEGELVSVLGYTGDDGTGAPRAITPQPGDSFTILHTLIKLHSDDPDAEVEYITQEGDTVTFGDNGLKVADVAAPAGSYVLGVQAEDADGNSYESYGTVTVNE